ncbi:MAG: FHA domain-containing protein [Deltaproteobacteria bacterium]|nr:FHA domain-containing protein [Deltaproteobacteria bacterium]
MIDSNMARDELMTSLHIINGPLEDFSFHLEKETTLIGRSSGNDVQIKDQSVSKRHAKILRKGEKYFIEDLNSYNGTQILGNPIEPGVLFELDEGIPVTIGNVAISLGKEFLVDGMKSRFCINLSGQRGKGGREFLYKDRRITSRRNLEVIYEVSTVLMQTLDIDDICEKIMETLFSYFKRINSGVILLIDDKTGNSKCITARSRNSKKQIKSNYSRTIVNRVIREGRAVIMSDTSREDKDNLSDSMKAMRIKSVMCVPMICKSGIRGIIYVHSVNVAPGFRKEDLLLLSVLSSPAALAIENSLLYLKRKKVEEELVKAKRLESIGILAGGIAHDYNNLLTGILGNITLAQLYIKPGNKAFNFLVSAEESSLRAKDLTQKLITFSRGGVPAKNTVPISGLLKNTTEIALSGSNINCEFAIPDDLWSVYIDEAQIVQAIHNLVINAVEAMPKGGTIRIVPRNLEVEEKNSHFLKKGRYLKISIIDEGVGIPEEHLEKVFDPYFSTKEMGMRKGTGLGLSICHSIIKKHKGHITVESEVGVGTAFHIFLPASEPQP